MLKLIGANLPFALPGSISTVDTLPFADARRPAGTRSALRLGMLSALATGLGLTVAQAGQLSPADRYVACVDRVASESASRHVGDVEVARSPVPAQVLREISRDDVDRACGSLADAAYDDDVVKAGTGRYQAAMAAAENALVEHPPQRQPPPPGSDDYEHGEKLTDDVAMRSLSPECRGLLHDFVAPASCAEAAREANRREKADEQAKEKTFAALPYVRYCLGLEYDTMPEKTESIVNEALARMQAMNDEQYSRLTECSLRVRTAPLPIVQHCLGLKRIASQNSEDPFQPLDDEMRIKQAAMDRLRAMDGDDWAKVGACGKRVEAAGGLAAIDPLGEMERVNRIPAVQDSSKQYSDCITGRAVQMAHVSAEPAETIARAALGGCALLRQQYLAVVARELDTVMTPERAAEEEKETAGALVGQIIAARAAATGAH